MDEMDDMDDMDKNNKARCDAALWERQPEFKRNKPQAWNAAFWILTSVFCR